MKKISDLTLQQQETLRTTLHEYHVQVDPQTMRPYVRFMGEDVDYNSVADIQLLLS
jgi:hypothetical protein